MKDLNKKLVLGASLGAAALSFAAVNWFKKNIPLSPVVPQTDENTVLLVQHTYSPFCLKVAKVMDYKGIPYKTVDLLPMIHKNFVKEFSGQKLVPVIKHKGKVISDSTVIAKYLESIVPEPSIYLEDEALNKEVILLEDWADESLEPIFGKLAVIYLVEHPEVISETDDYNVGLDLFDNNKEKIAPFVAKGMLKGFGAELKDKDQLKRRAREALDILSTKLEGKKFLVGDRLTIADITIASHLSVAQKVPYIAEDDKYEAIFTWQKEIFNASKRRFASSLK